MNIRPKDWKTAMYWIHIGLIVVGLLWLLNTYYCGQLFTLENWVKGTVILGGLDIAVHTTLQID